MLFSDKEKRRKSLLALLMVFVITLVAGFIIYGIKYHYKADPFKTIAESDISESQTSPSSKIPKVSEILLDIDISKPDISKSQSSPCPPLVPKILLDLENKIFVKTDPLELTQKELEALELLSSFEINNPILQYNKNLRITKEIYSELVVANNSYFKIKLDIDIYTLSPETIKAYQTLIGRNVSCFQKVRKELGDPFEESFDINFPVPSSQYMPQMDFRLDDRFVSELNCKFPNFATRYQILLKPQTDLKELLLILCAAEQFTPEDNLKYRRRPAIANFSMNICEKFSSIWFYKLKNDPDILLNLFNEDLTLLLTLSALSPTPSYGPGILSDIVNNGFLFDSDLNERFRTAQISLIFLMLILEKYFLPDLPFSEHDPMPNGIDESYRAILNLIETLSLKVSSLRLLGASPNAGTKKYFDNELPLYIKYWKQSMTRESERLYISSQTDFLFLKRRFRTAINSNDPEANFHLIRIIYWSLNFRFTKKFDIELLASFPDPRDVILIMICSKSWLSLEEKGNLAKLLYIDNNKDGNKDDYWYYRKEFFHLFEYIQYILFDSIPLELFRKEDLGEWDKVGFSSFARQVMFLQERQSSIHLVRQLFKEQFEKSLKNLENVDSSANLADSLGPFFNLSRQVRERCENEGIDYFEDLKLQTDGELPAWLLDLTNNLLSRFSESFDKFTLNFSFEEQLSLCSHQDIQEFYESIVNSPGKKGFFGLFNNLDILIEMEEKKCQPFSGENSSVKIPAKIVPSVEIPFSFDLECSHFSSSEIQSEFGINRGEFISQLILYFRYPEAFEQILKEKFPKNFDQAVKYGKIEIPFLLKFKFWLSQSSFLLSLKELFQPQSLTALFKSWNCFISVFKNLLNSHIARTAEYPPLKINFFAGVRVTKAFVGNENELFALKTINKTLRLLERLIDSDTDIKEVEKILEKVLILSLLFLQPAEEQNRADFFFNLYDGRYKELKAKLEPDFSKHFGSKTLWGFEMGSVKLFEKIKRQIKAESFPFDPVLVMELGQIDQKKSIRSILWDIMEDFKSFRDPNMQDREMLLSSLDGFRSKLLDLVGKTESDTGAKYRNIRYFYRSIIESLSIENSKLLQTFLRSLDDANFLGQDPKPIIENFIETEMRPRIPAK
jgi:hypothetical protein